MKVMKSATKRSRNLVDFGPCVAPRRCERSTSSNTSSTGSSHSSTESSAAKGKSKSAKDKSNKSAPDEFRIWTGKGWGKTQNKQILKPKAEPKPVAKKIPEKLKKKPAAAPEKSKKDESELAPTDRLRIWITPDSNDLEELSEWSSPSEYHMQ